MRKIFTFLFAALMSVGAMAQTETLLTTITATAQEQASYSTANVATVSFSYTAGGSSAYLANWGWWGYGWSATVNAAEGYTITKCVFYDDANRTATDSEAPFVVETTEEDKTPKVNGTPIEEDMSKGIKKIDVYGYATPEPEPEPQPAEPITVTWNSYDLPSSGSSFTKDGVTLTCDIDDDLYGPGTFTTDLGNFTQIVVSGDEACYIDATGGWSGNINQKTWTGNAAIVPWGGGIYCFSSDVTIVFTIESQGGETAVENVQTNHVQGTKILRNGMLLIERNGKLYNATGAEVK